MKSILPTELESKRRRIARTHNSLCVYMLALVFGSFLLGFAVIHITHASRPTGIVVLVVAVVVAGLIEIFGLRRIVQHDNELCHQLDYICPFCHEPLYEARASIGLCPKCRKSVV